MSRFSRASPKLVLGVTQGDGLRWACSTGVDERRRVERGEPPDEPVLASGAAEEVDGERDTATAGLRREEDELVRARRVAPEERWRRHQGSLPWSSRCFKLASRDFVSRSMPCAERQPAR